MFMKRDCYDFGAHKGCKSEDKIELISEEVVAAEKRRIDSSRNAAVYRKF